MEKTNFNGSLNDLSMIFFSAFRYALGRRTYIVSWVCEVISNNIHLLLDKDLVIMKRDIEEQKKDGFGDDIDKVEWLNLYELIEKEIERRGENDQD